MRLTALLLALGLMLGCGPSREEYSKLLKHTVVTGSLHRQIELDYYQSYDELLKLDNPKVNGILFKHMASVGKLEDQIKQEAAK